ILFVAIAVTYSLLRLYLSIRSTSLNHDLSFNFQKSCWRRVVPPLVSTSFRAVGDELFPLRFRHRSPC
ncbi:hypothetical protein LINPERPRIM_LOCUS32910, partial [Linum perenne]